MAPADYKNKHRPQHTNTEYYLRIVKQFTSERSNRKVNLKYLCCMFVYFRTNHYAHMFTLSHLTRTIYEQYFLYFENGMSQFFFLYFEFLINTGVYNMHACTVHMFHFHFGSFVYIKYN